MKGKFVMKKILFVFLLVVLLLSVFPVGLVKADGIEFPHIYAGTCVTKKGKNYFAGPYIHWVNMPMNTIVSINNDRVVYRHLWVPGNSNLLVIDEESGFEYSQNLLKLNENGYHITYEYLGKIVQVYLPSASEAAEVFPDVDPCPFPYPSIGRNN
jgi:hypothetical protein